MQRRNIKSGAVWEEEVAYSRAVRIGNHIEVAGTVATKEGKAVHAGDAYQQTCFILEKIKSALSSLDCGLEDVVRTRMYVVNIDQWKEIARAHVKYFKGIDPVTTMIEVSRLIEPSYLVEIEATAIKRVGKQKEI